MSEQPPNQWGQNPYQQPQQNHPTQPLGAQPQWGGQQGQQAPQQWANQPAQNPYGQPQWGQGPGGPGGPGGPMGPGGPGGPGQPGSRKTLWLVLVAVLVLVAAAVVVAILVFTGDDDDDKDDSKGDETTSASPSDTGSSTPTEEPTEETSEPTDPTSSASTETSAPVDDDVLFVFPDQVDGRTLDTSTGPDGGKVAAGDSFVSATYKGSDMADMMIFQYMTSLDAKSYAEATDNEVQQIGDAYCAKVLDSMEAYACAVDFKDGILFTSSNMTTVNDPKQVAETLDEMVRAIG